MIDSSFLLGEEAALISKGKEITPTNKPQPVTKYGRESRQNAAKKRTGVDTQIVIQNESIPDTPEGQSVRLDLAFVALEGAGLLKNHDLVIRGLVTPTGRLTDQARNIILSGHRAGDGVYGDFASVADKARATRALPQEWRRLLMEQGIM